MNEFEPGQVYELEPSEVKRLSNLGCVFRLFLEKDRVLTLNPMTNKKEWYISEFTRQEIRNMGLKLRPYSFIGNTTKANHQPH